MIRALLTAQSRRRADRLRRPLLNGYCDAHASAAADLALDRILTTQRLHAFLHAEEPEADRFGRIKAVAVIVDEKIQLAQALPVGAFVMARFMARFGEANINTLGVGVFDGVRYAFLRATIDRQIDRIAVAVAQPIARK